MKHLIMLTSLSLLAFGCSSTKDKIGITNQQQPGPAVGRVVGGGAGLVAGNVAAGAVGVGEGFAGGVRSSFDNTQRVVRYWKEEKTADGRVILVPENFLVDENGRVIRKIQ